MTKSFDINKNFEVKEYLKIHEYYENKFGKDNSIVLMQVGSFHELYSTLNKGPDVEHLSNLLGIIATKKNKNIPEVSEKNPFMMGFPTGVLFKFVNMLLEYNYHVIVIDQTTLPPNPERHITGIYSPATFINNDTNISETNKKDNNNIVSIFISEEKNLQGNYLTCIGISAVDLFTGDVSFHESYSKIDDKNYAFDEIIRFFQTYPPSEIVISIEEELSHSELVNKDNFLSYLGIVNKPIYYINDKKKIKENSKINFQQKYFEKIYQNDSILSIIEYLDLDRLFFSRLSLINLFDYCQEHNSKTIRNLKLPIKFNQNKYLFMGNSCIEQLDIISNHNNSSQNITSKNNSVVSYNSLYDIINKTKTSLGKRYLKNNLLNPIIDKDILNARYELIDILNQESYDNLEILDNNLKKITDIEKLDRKLGMNMLQPCELLNLYNSLLSIKEIIETDIFSIDQNYNELNLLNDEKIIKLDKLIDLLENVFDFDKMTNLMKNDIKESFFNVTFSKKINDLQNEINFKLEFLSNIALELEKNIPETKINYMKNTNIRLVKLEHNEVDKHHFLITKRRLDLMKKNLDKNKIKEISIPNSEIGNKTKTKIKISDLEFNDMPKSSSTKINGKMIREISLFLSESKSNITSLIKEEYDTVCIKIFDEYKNLLKDTSVFVSYIDFIRSGSICSLDNRYTKPIIKEKEKSYFISKELRHPLVEKINTNTEYKTHDIALGVDNQDGILLYGINSSGKSTLMKSIGVNIILAQIGYFVAAKEFTYNPYHSILTRISSNDNIFKGLSSFMVEGIELRAILKRNNENSLIICDEVCRGTEVKSANIIVVYMIEKLSRFRSSFISATHLHELLDFKSIKKLSCQKGNLKIFHIGVTYNSDDKTLIFDRKLQPGQGESFYGLKVAKYIMDDKEFEKRTDEITDEFETNGESKPVLSKKKSRYNSLLYMDVCLICKNTDNLETHHICWQKDCDKQGFIKEKPHIKKNHLSNLMPICASCHDQVDRGDILVYGWKETTNGLILDYELKNQNNTKNKTIDNTKPKVNTIPKLKTKTNTKNNLNVKEIIKSLSIKKDKKISFNKLMKMIKENQMGIHNEFEELEEKDIKKIWKDIVVC